MSKYRVILALEEYGEDGMWRYDCLLKHDILFRTEDKAKAEQFFNGLAAEPSFAKRLARAYERAHELHILSWNAETHEYSEEAEECFIRACEECTLELEVWFVLYLASDWSNDMHAWAKSVEHGTFNELFKAQPKKEEKEKER